MNTLLWLLQALIAVTFIYSGINKSIFDKQKLVAAGQTGVEDLSIPVIRFIGITEILGAIGLIFPILLNIAPFLSVAAAIGLALIMIPAGVIHYRRGEYKNTWANVLLFLICIFIAWGRS